MISPLSPPSGCFEGKLHRYAVRVFYEDTDLSGVVYHANYLRWFERGRSDMIRLMGIDQRSVLETEGGAFAVVEANLRYLAPAKLDDVVIVETLLEEVGAASTRVLQRAYRGETLLCEGRLRVGFVGPDGRPRRQPAEWRHAFAAIGPDVAE